jgi:hypothetical protein
MMVKIPEPLARLLPFQLEAGINEEGWALVPKSKRSCQPETTALR